MINQASNSPRGSSLDLGLCSLSFIAVMSMELFGLLKRLVDSHLRVCPQGQRNSGSLWPSEKLIQGS